MIPQYMVFPDYSSRSILAGIYFPNGVMKEQIKELGASYAVDGLLFEIISDLDIDIRVHTFYGFSEFLLFLPPENAEHILKKAIAILLEPHFTAETLSEWQTYQKPRVENRGRFDAAYYQARFPNSRMAKPIRGRAEDILAHTIDDLERWHDRFYTQEQMCVCITGCVTPEFAQHTSLIFPHKGRFRHINDLCLQRDDAAPVQNVHISSKHRGKTDLVVAYSVEVEPEEIWSWEGACCAIKAQLRDVLRPFGATLQGPLLILSTSSELRIHIRCSVKHTQALIYRIMHSVCYFMERINRSELEIIRREIAEIYRELSADFVEWNRFLGWNAILGPWYEPELLWHSDACAKKVTLEGMQLISLKLNNSSKPLCFVLDL